METKKYTNEQLVEMGKKNLARFRCMTKELQNFYKSIGENNVMMLLPNGEWAESGQSESWSDDIYRIPPSYQLPAEEYRAEVYQNNERLFVNRLPCQRDDEDEDEDNPILIESAPSYADFDGFYEDGVFDDSGPYSISIEQVASSFRDGKHPYAKFVGAK